MHIYINILQGAVTVPATLSTKTVRGGAGAKAARRIESEMPPAFEMGPDGTSERSAGREQSLKLSEKGSVALEVRVGRVRERGRVAGEGGRGMWRVMAARCEEASRKAISKAGPRDAPPEAIERSVWCRRAFDGTGSTTSVTVSTPATPRFQMFSVGRVRSRRGELHTYIYINIHIHIYMYIYVYIHTCIYIYI